MEIPCSNLLEWLVCRGVLTADWVDADAEATKRLVSVKADRQAPATFPGVGPRDVGYREARLRLHACLQNPALAHTTLFGRYKDPYVDELYDIVSLWEKSNAHIGSLALRLVEDSKYELPSIRASISATEKQYTTLGKRIDECEQSLRRSQLDYEAACRSWTIEGVDPAQVRDELLRLEARIPALVTKVEVLLKQAQFDRCWQYYTTFMHVTHCISNGKTFDTPINESISHCLPVIRDIRERGTSSKTCDDVNNRQCSDEAAQSIASVCDRRLELINELSELHAFLETRVSELKETEDFVFVFSETLHQAKRTYPLLSLSAEDVLEIDRIVIIILDMLKDPEIVRISSMLSRKDGVKKAEQAILSFRCQEERLRSECTAGAERRLELQNKLKELKDRASEVSTHSKALKAELEGVLLKALPNLSVVLLVDA